MIEKRKFPVPQLPFSQKNSAPVPKQVLSVLLLHPVTDVNPPSDDE
jgi:hypothetical protein